MTYINYLGIGLEIVGQYQNIIHFLKSAKTPKPQNPKTPWHSVAKMDNYAGKFTRSDRNLDLGSAGFSFQMWRPAS